MAEPAQLSLRDIHLPGPVSWWPPAPGWWLLLCLLLLIVAALWYWRRRRQQQRLSALYLARQEYGRLEQQLHESADAREVVSQLSALLRRLAISAYPRDETAGLTGEDWLRFLDARMQSPEFSRGPGRILLEAPYRQEVNKTDIEPLFDVCRRWLDAVEQDKSRKRDDSF